MRVTPLRLEQNIARMRVWVERVHVENLLRVNVEQLAHQPLAVYSRIQCLRFPVEIRPGTSRSLRQVADRLHWHVQRHAFRHRRGTLQHFGRGRAASSARGVHQPPLFLGGKLLGGLTSRGRSALQELLGERVERAARAAVHHEHRICDQAAASITQQRGQAWMVVVERRGEADLRYPHLLTGAAQILALDDEIKLLRVHLTLRLDRHTQRLVQHSDDD
eukprot:441160-Prymnesium_polylepis.2